MDRIPPEILTHIFSYLPHQELLTTIRQVCSHWRSTSFYGVLWMNIDLKDWEDWELELYLSHMCHVAEFVQTLQIQCEQLKTIFKTIMPNADNFSNLRKLSLLGVFPDDEVKFCKHIIKLFPKLTSININFSTGDLPNCLLILSILQLNEFDLLTSISSNLALLNFISCQPNLTSLAIWGEDLQSDTLSQMLNYLDNLQCLDITCMDELDGSAFDGFQAFPKLTTIRLSDTGIDDIGLQLITERATNLKTVFITDNYNLTDVGICYIGNNCANLECLTILDSDVSFRNVSLSYQTLAMLGNGCPKLKQLGLADATNLTDSGIISLVNNCEQLQRIGIHSINISTAILVAISDVSVRLSHLTICGRNLNVSGIERVLTQNKQLKYLSIEYCVDIHKIDLRKFINGYANEDSRRHSCINSIDIKGCSFSSCAVIDEIATLCPDLRSLALPSCENAHMLMLETVFRKCTFLEDIRLGANSIKRPEIRKNIANK